MYHYAANNPVRYTDPDGRVAFVDDGIIVAIIVIGIVVVKVAADSCDNSGAMYGAGSAGFGSPKNSFGTISLSKSGSSSSEKPSPMAKKGAVSAAPSPNNGHSNGKHGKDDHNDAIDKKVEELKSEDAKNIRKNQAQVDADGNKVGNNKPDLQWDDSGGKHHCWEIDRVEKNSIKHGQVIRRNDPSAIVELELLN